MNWKKLVKRLKIECTIHRGLQRTKHKTKHFENEIIKAGIEEFTIDFESYLYPFFCYPSVGRITPQMGRITVCYPSVGRITPQMGRIYSFSQCIGGKF